MSYRQLEIWKLARQSAIDIHRMTLKELPKFEMYEEGSQIRRSVKSIRSNIVEGYGRRRYKQDFIRFLVFAHSSCDETIDHLEGLFETESLTIEATYRDLSAQLDRDDTPHPASRIPHPAS
jgi:four helix bundle protein